MANFIERLVKAPDKELLSYVEVAAYLALGPDDFKERVATYHAYPHGSNPERIEQSTWTWQEALGMLFNKPWHEALYLKRRKYRKTRATAQRKGRKTKTDTDTKLGRERGERAD